ncbi:hypothetical protein [Haloarcula laminariae]|uniref:hypothetical protein n=1 Tax=Haloarcula laminariae TaxID=2961577 RepID=UPI0021C60D20|nr:hypothetical protein [Halomicroarcula laminariae]
MSLGVVGRAFTDPLTVCLDTYEVLLPEIVVDELEDIASYDDAHGCGAQAVLDQAGGFSVQSVSLDATFPLDDGENAAVTLANDIDAAMLLCDEFNQLGLIHASLANTRLVTTPTLLSVFVRNGQLDTDVAMSSLDAISEARSWDSNQYVDHARSLAT